MGILGFATLAVYARRYPVEWVPADLEQLAPLHLGNLVALAALLLRLGAINLSAWCLGSGLTRRWPVPWTRSGERAGPRPERRPS